MYTARIAALLEPFLEQPLAPSQLDQISTYIDLLLRWNARINLTAIRKEEEIVTRHFGESFFLASHLFPKRVARTLLSANADGAQPLEDSQPSTPCRPERSQDMREAHVLAESKDPYTCSAPAPPQGVLAVSSNSPRVLDVGSGAGFPALPIKIWAPQIHLTLIESNHKKAAFLREVVRALTLTNVDVITDRAEILAASPDVPKADLVTLRAVERFDEILPSAVAFLAPKASLALLISAAQLPKIPILNKLSWYPQINVPKSHSRVLLIGYPPSAGTK
jgi:16S rRNA (guanine(527)-N(7))-methyltransferase RsmG